MGRNCNAIRCGIALQICNSYAPVFSIPGLTRVRRFLPRDAMHVRYQSWACVCVYLCLSVCLSVTSRSSTKTDKRWITLNKTTRQLRDSSFLVPKISEKFVYEGAKCRWVGWVKIGDFRQIAGFISKTVQGRRMSSIKVEQQVVCALSNGGIAHDLECSLTTQKHPIFCILHRHLQLRNG